MFILGLTFIARGPCLMQGPSICMFACLLALPLAEWLAILYTVQIMYVVEEIC